MVRPDTCGVDPVRGELAEQVHEDLGGEKVGENAGRNLEAEGHAHAHRPGAPRSIAGLQRSPRSARPRSSFAEEEFCLAG